MTKKPWLLLLLLFTIPCVLATTITGGNYEVVLANSHWSLENASGGVFTASVSTGPAENISGGAYTTRTIPPFIIPAVISTGSGGGSGGGGSGGGGSGGQTIYNYCKRAGGRIVTLDNGQVRCEINSAKDNNATVTTTVKEGLSNLATLGAKIWPEYPAFGWMMIIAVLGLLLNFMAADRERRTMKALVKGKKKAKEELEDEDDE